MGSDHRPVEALSGQTSRKAGKAKDGVRQVGLWEDQEAKSGGPAFAGSRPNSRARKIEYPADSARDLTMDVAGWPVGVGGARPCPGSPTRVFLKNRAMSGSGTEVKGQHIFDPRTGLPAGGHLAAWASHASAAESNALSTAFIVMRTDEVEEYCRRHPDVWALVFLFDGTCRQFGDVPKRDTLFS